MSRSTAVLLLLVLAAVATPPHNARAGELRSGDRVRVDTTDSEGRFTQLEGTVVSMDDETIMVRTDRESQPVPRSDISRVDRWVSTERHTFEGTMIGTGAGILVGLFAWQSDESSNDSNVHIDSPLYMVFFGVIGAGLGALIGHAARTERWEPVDSFSLELSPSREDHAHLAVVLSFDL